MNIRIEVKNRREGEALRAGLADPQVRAFVQVVGVLNGLSSDRARARVLSFLWDQVTEIAPTLDATESRYEHEVGK